MPRFLQLPLFGKLDGSLKQLVQGLFRGPVVAAPKSDGDLYNLWVQLREEYFPAEEELDRYHVFWSSRRQRRVLASCNNKKKQVRVAQELSCAEYRQWLTPLLFHEMCHAVLGRKVSTRGSKHLWHGPEFKDLARRHPLTGDLHHWIRSGGWQAAVRSARSKAAARRR
jgi:hypothetical protein